MRLFDKFLLKLFFFFLFLIFLNSAICQNKIDKLGLNYYRVQQNNSFGLIRIDSSDSQIDTILILPFEYDSINFFPELYAFKLPERYPFPNCILSRKNNDTFVYDQNGNKLRQTDSEYEAVGLAGTGGLELNSTLHGYYDMKVIGDKVAYTRVVVNKFQGQYEIGPCNTSDADCLRKAPQNLYEQATYSIGQGWLRLKKTTVTNYDGADELIRVTTHAYENTPVHYQPITIQTEAGDQQVYTTYLYYPDDLNDIYMSNLVAANRTGEVIETIEYKGTDNTGIELRKKKTSFKLIGGTKVYPDKLYFSQKGHPLEERIEFVEYDNHGNPLEVIQTGGASEAYAWGYGGTLPVINAKNASSAELTAAIAAAITATPLPTGIDTLEELLSHVGNLSMPDQRSDWAFFTQKLNEQLSNAQGSTMTYDTVYGMTSQTTPNGMVQYFEYDAYGRLKYIKDRDLNILKMNEYAYKVNAGSTQN